jgi:hypothetical protein
MSNPSKAKGSGFEVECVKVALFRGHKAKRAWGSNGRAMGEHEEVDLVIDNMKFQCKRRAKIAQDLFPGVNVDAQIIRADRQTTAFVVVSFPKFLDLMRAYDNQQSRLPLELRDTTRTHGEGEISEGDGRTQALAG